jgi:hypothetical protein
MDVPTRSNLQRAERGTYVNETMKSDDVSQANVEEVYREIAQEERLQAETTLQATMILEGEIVPFSRVSDFEPEVRLYKGEEIEGCDFYVDKCTKYVGDFGDFLTLEIRFVHTEDGVPGILNMGGKVAMPKIERAYRMVEAGKARGPLVMCLRQKPMSGNRWFWDVE